MHSILSCNKYKAYFTTYCFALLATKGTEKAGKLVTKKEKNSKKPQGDIFEASWSYCYCRWCSSPCGYLFLLNLKWSRSRMLARGWVYGSECILKWRHTATFPDSIDHIYQFVGLLSFLKSFTGNYSWLYNVGLCENCSPILTSHHEGYFGFSWCGQLSLWSRILPMRRDIVGNIFCRDLRIILRFCSKFIFQPWWNWVSQTFEQLFQSCIFWLVVLLQFRDMLLKIANILALLKHCPWCIMI